MENLGLDIRLLIAQGVNFLVFFYIFKRFLAAPFLKFLSEEKQKEIEKLRLEEEISKKKKAFQEEEKRNREELKKQLDLLRTELKREIDQERKKILIQAKNQAELIKEKAARDLERKKRMLEKQVKERIINLSILLIEKGLKDILNENTKKELTRNILKNLDNQIDLRL